MFVTCFTPFKKKSSILLHVTIICQFLPLLIFDDPSIMKSGVGILRFSSSKGKSPMPLRRHLRYPPSDKPVNRFTGLVTSK